MKKLAICIPTYNRVKFINTLLENIISQIAYNYEDEVQVCVSDNCSNDKTNEYMQQLVKKNPHIDFRYSRNSSNMGSDRNFILCVGLADAEYCWLMGSDDDISKNAISSVLKSIRENADADVVIVQRDACTFKMKKMFSGSWIPMKNNFRARFTEKQEKVQLFKSIDSTTAICGLISVIIFKKTSWDAILDYENYIGTAYVQTYKLLSYLEQYGGVILYTTDVIVKARYGNDSFHENLGQRIMLDIYSFYKLSNIFRDLITRKAFLGILIRHYNNVFMCALALSNYNITSETLAVLKEIGYSDKQLKVFRYNKLMKCIVLCKSLTVMLFKEPRRFFQTVLVTIEKMKIH